MSTTTSGIRPTVIGGYPGLDTARTSAFHIQRASDSFVRWDGSDEPRLTLHDYHRSQRSPLLSTSPEYNQKRIRRKPSLQDLSKEPPEEAPFTWGPSSAPPHAMCSFDALGSSPFSFLQAHSHPPTTPRLRHTITSPSLSSTVTTLQSTPTNTPNLRGGSSLGQRWPGQCDIEGEQIRTKRNFQSPKRAKRLPRPANSGGDSTSRADNELWEVYAAIFDPPIDLGEGPVTGEQRSSGLGREALRILGQARGNWIGGNSVDSAGGRRAECEHKSVASEKEVEHSTLPSPPSREQRFQPDTSSYSLTKFEFPVPPGHDNWAGTFGHREQRGPAETSTTVLYRGTSFDVVNPHASLLYDVYNFETPAEIDGLLDDYFQEPSHANMQYDRLTGEPSEHSLRATSEHSRRARKLYEDPDTARRGILCGAKELPAPPPAVLRDSPLNVKSHYSMPTPPDSIYYFPPLSPDETPLPAISRKPSTNPYRNGKISSIRKAIGVFASPSEPDQPFQQSEVLENGDMQGNTPMGFSHDQSHVSSKHQSCCSDQFDLYLSKSASELGMANVASVMENGQRSEGGHIVEPRADDEGESSQATSTEVDTDPTIKEILKSYDYTRLFENPFRNISSPSVERGLGIAFGSSNEGSHAGFTFRAGPSSSSKGPQQTPGQVKFAFPTPPAPAYTGLRYYSDCTDLPTSEQTYGETNQLLQITPEIAQIPPYDNRERSGTEPSGQPHAEWYAATATGPRPDDDPYEPTTSTYHPFEHDDKENIPPFGSPDPRGGNHAAEELVNHRNVPHRFQFVERRLDEVVRRALPRSSSCYPGDTDSAWETQFSDSQNDLVDPMKRSSRASYADTSIYGSQDDLTRETDLPPRPSNPAFGESQPPAENIFKRSSIGRALSKTLGKSESKKPAPIDTGLKPFMLRTHPDDSRSDKRHLINTPPGFDSSPYPNVNLQWSESRGSFVTVRDLTPEAKYGVPELWSPFDRKPTLRAMAPTTLPSDSSGGLQKHGKSPVEILRNKGKDHRSSKAAVKNQSKMIELRLLPSHKTKRYDKAKKAGLTDAELVAREPGWTARPYMAANSPLAKYTNPESSFYDRNLNEKRLLRKPDDLEYLPTREQEQREVWSKHYLNVTLVFPLVPFAYGLGWFDGYMRRKSGGRFKGMAPQQKRTAVRVAGPLGLLGWAIIVVLSYLLSKIMKGDIQSGGNSSPF